jgi:hypothetical protein
LETKLELVLMYIILSHENRCNRQNSALKVSVLLSMMKDHQLSDKVSVPGWQDDLRHDV